MREKPRQKSKTRGYGALTNGELVSLIIGHGNIHTSVYEISQSATRYITLFSEGMYSLEELEKALYSVQGLGEAKVMTIIAAIELARRLHTVRERSYASPEQIVTLCSALRTAKQEKAIVIFLDSQYKIIKKVTLFKGTSDRLPFSPREIYIKALSVEAKYIILVHNHPSGNHEASSQDISETKRIQTLGKELEIYIVDHIIISRFGYMSFKERGIL